MNFWSSKSKKQNNRMQTLLNSSLNKINESKKYILIVKSKRISFKDSS